MARPGAGCDQFPAPTKAGAKGGLRASTEWEQAPGSRRPSSHRTSNPKRTLCAVGTPRESRPGFSKQRTWDRCQEFGYGRAEASNVHGGPAASHSASGDRTYLERRWHWAVALSVSDSLVLKALGRFARG